MMKIKLNKAFFILISLVHLLAPALLHAQEGIAGVSDTEVRKQIERMSAPAQLDELPSRQQITQGTSSGKLEGIGNAPPLQLDWATKRRPDAPPPPPLAADEEEQPIEFNFEDASLTNLVSQISELYRVTFITDDSVDPIGQFGKAVEGNRISFRTHKPLTREQAWNLFITFLDLSGLSIVPHAQPGFYRITSIDTAKKITNPCLYRR